MENVILGGDSHKKCKHCQDATVPTDPSKNHPDYTSLLSRLSKVKGQMSGIENMILERRYCVDILIQFKAVAAGLKFIEMAILKQHIRSCVRMTMKENNKVKIEEKIDELIRLVSSRLE